MPGKVCPFCVLMSPEDMTSTQGLMHNATFAAQLHLACVASTLLLGHVCVAWLELQCHLLR